MHLQTHTQQPAVEIVSPCLDMTSRLQNACQCWQEHLSKLHHHKCQSQSLCLILDVSHNLARKQTVLQSQWLRCGRHRGLFLVLTVCACVHGTANAFCLVLMLCACAEDTAALHQQLHPDAASSALPAEASGVLGTSFYISPEIANGWPQYDNKVDLYSLGVIAFELWHPFSTVMERVGVLRDLVERGVMPPSWPEAHPVVCTPHTSLPFTYFASHFYTWTLHVRSCILFHACTFLHPLSCMRVLASPFMHAHSLCTLCLQSMLAHACCLKSSNSVASCRLVCIVPMSLCLMRCCLCLSQQAYSLAEAGDGSGKTLPFLCKCVISDTVSSQPEALPASCFCRPW